MAGDVGRVSHRLNQVTGLVEGRWRDTLSVTLSVLDSVQLLKRKRSIPLCNYLLIVLPCKTTPLCIVVSVTGTRGSPKDGQIEIGGCGAEKR